MNFLKKKLFLTWCKNFTYIKSLASVSLLRMNICFFLTYPKIKHMQQTMENEIPERTDVEMNAASNSVDAEDFMQELLGTVGIRSK